MGNFRQTYTFAQFAMWFSDRTGRRPGQIPGATKTAFKLQEDAMIIEAQAWFDNMWSKMAKLLPGRTSLEHSIDKKMLSIINNTPNY